MEAHGLPPETGQRAGLHLGAEQASPPRRRSTPGRAHLLQFPILSDLEVDGEQIPALIQTTKTGIIFVFNRETGEPIWPIEERPVQQTEVPGNWTSPTQPIPTRPESFEPLGLPEDTIIDFTPELRARAMEILADYRVGGPYMPRMHIGHESEYINNIRCDGGLNITSPATMDPTTGIMYASSSFGCGGGFVMPGIEADIPDDPATTGTTISQWVAGPGGGLPRLDGLPLWKPPYARISAYDMNTGERIWWIPLGDLSDEIANHPALQGVDTSRFGGGGSSINMVAGELLISEFNSGGVPALHAYDKLTGEPVGEVELPGPGQYGMMTYLHEGQQYLAVQIGDPARLVTLTLP